MKKPVIAVVILVALILAVAAIPTVNDLVADGLERELRNAPLPENTVLIESMSKAGKMAGNGNGMQYFGAILIKSNLSLADIDRHYSKYRDGNFDFVVKRQIENRIKEIEIGEAEWNQPIDDGLSYYIVYTWGKSVPFFSQVDLRGH